ncbi:hypothetical protein GUJ93_ZPchr0002g25061 [Zizania palustris]|uniref:Uncharacterized protein n=1 Tax=Zizania palustris TaxID=103762 RepID=A0A8J5VUV6_ZIZPA|nr:hypothetical protein GUJ93_ZPchr0002g25061 [Zizania palustris]
MPRRERSQVTNPRKKLCGEGETEEMPEREEAGRGGICPKKMSAQGGIAGNAYQVTPGDERARGLRRRRKSRERRARVVRGCAPPPPKLGTEHRARLPPRATDTRNTAGD